MIRWAAQILSIDPRFILSDIGWRLSPDFYTQYSLISAAIRVHCAGSRRNMRDVVLRAGYTQCLIILISSTAVEMSVVGN